MNTETSNADPGVEARENEELNRRLTQINADFMWDKDEENASFPKSASICVNLRFTFSRLMGCTLAAPCRQPVLNPTNFLRLLPALALVLFAGCDLQDMYRQPKREPLQASDFFADGRSARPLEADTVAQSAGWKRRFAPPDDQRRDASVTFYTGKSDGKDVEAVPFPVTKEVLLRGRERFNVFCSTCHDRTGNGNGMIVQRGFRRPPSFHTAQLRQMPIGHFFDVMTNGFGTMPDYAAQVPPEDRWSIAAYVRTLQFSQHAPVADVPPDKIPQLKEAKP